MKRKSRKKSQNFNTSKSDDKTESNIIDGKKVK